MVMGFSRVTMCVYMVVGALLVLAMIIGTIDAVSKLVDAVLAYSTGDIDVLLNYAIQSILVLIVLATLIDMVRSYMRYGRVLIRPILVAGITTTVRRLLVTTLTVADIIGIGIIILVLTAAILFLGREDRIVAKSGLDDEEAFALPIFKSKRKNANEKTEESAAGSTEEY